MAGEKVIMITYKKATKDDLEILMKIRMEMLRVVNNLPSGYEHDAILVAKSREYFENGDQTTILAINNNEVIGCASISYINIMPTFSHPTGKRAHLMNVYTKKEYRRRGISMKMVEILIDEAKEQGVTEISLDATDMGRPLYEAIGFTSSETGMVLELV